MEGTPRLLDVFDVKVSLDKEGKSWNCIRLDGHLFFWRRRWIRSDGRVLTGLGTIGGGDCRWFQGLD